MALKDLLDNGVVFGAALVAGVTVATLVGRRSGSFDEDDDFDLQTELEEGVKIQDARGGGYEAWHGREKIGREKSRKFLLFRIGQWMKKQGYFPNIFYVNERGNTDLINARGKILRSWI